MAKPTEGEEPTAKAVAADEAAQTAAESAELADAAVAQAKDDAKAAQKAADKNRPPCPHCGRLLRLEHDVGDHMHCDSDKCVDCCFEPGADGPVLRSGYGVCPAA